MGHDRRRQDDALAAVSKQGDEKIKVLVIGASDQFIRILLKSFQRPSLSPTAYASGVDGTRESIQQLSECGGDCREWQRTFRSSRCWDGASAPRSCPGSQYVAGPSGDSCLTEVRMSRLQGSVPPWCCQANQRRQRCQQDPSIVSGPGRDQSPGRAQGEVDHRGRRNPSDRARAYPRRRNKQRAERDPR